MRYHVCTFAVHLSWSIQNVSLVRMWLDWWNPQLHLGSDPQRATLILRLLYFLRLQVYQQAIEILDYEQGLHAQPSPLFAEIAPIVCRSDRILRLLRRP